MLVSSWLSAGLAGWYLKSSLWSLVSDLSPLPLSPPPPCPYSFTPLLLLCQSSCPHHLPLHLPSSSTFSVVLMAKVTATSLFMTNPQRGLWLFPGPQ